jgi:WD and tetratricopeptide repeat-containing protein 1
LTNHSNGVSKLLSNRQQSQETQTKKYGKSRYTGKPLPPNVEAIKQRANNVFEKQEYAKAILLYNEAIALAPLSPVLYGNRAAAYMKRNWDGDLYAALRDCHSAIQLDPDHLKAHFRLAKCLFELSWRNEAQECLNAFKSKFPEYANSQACSHLDKDIKAALYSKTEADIKESERSQKSVKKKEAEISEQEKVWRKEAKDYDRRFCGHCNTTTDIKEANYFGVNGQYVVAGSDDGSFFIWDKKTTNIMRVLRGDDSIVNCLQPHPSYCMLATSGIDPVVRLWSPRAEDGAKDDREVCNSDDAAEANQKRMNADPLEVMLMNMGYSRFAGVYDSEEDEYREGEGHTPCRPS